MSRAPTLAAREAGRATRTAVRQERIASLCELVAEGTPVKEAARLIDITESSATGMMAEVRRDLGWQAA